MIIQSDWSFRDRQARAGLYPGGSSFVPASTPPEALNLGAAQLALEADLYRRAIRSARRSDGKTGAPVITHRAFDVAGVGAQTLVPGTEGGRIAVYQATLWNTAAQDVRLLDGPLVDLIGTLVGFPAGTGFYLPWQEEPHFITSPGQALMISGSAAGQITGFVKYRILPA